MPSEDWSVYARLYRISVDWLQGRGKPAVMSEAMRAEVDQLSNNDRYEVQRFAEFLVNGYRP